MRSSRQERITQRKTIMDMVNQYVGQPTASINRGALVQLAINLLREKEPKQYEENSALLKGFLQKVDAYDKIQNQDVNNTRSTGSRGRAIQKQMGQLDNITKGLNAKEKVMFYAILEDEQNLDKITGNEGMLAQYFKEQLEPQISDQQSLSSIPVNQSIGTASISSEPIDLEELKSQQSISSYKPSDSQSAYTYNPQVRSGLYSSQNQSFSLEQPMYSMPSLDSKATSKTGQKTRIEPGIEEYSQIFSPEAIAYINDPLYQNVEALEVVFKDRKPLSENDKQVLGYLYQESKGKRQQLIDQLSNMQDQDITSMIDKVRARANQGIRKRKEDVDRMLTAYKKALSNMLVKRTK